MAYTLTYTGSEIQALLDIVNSGGGASETYSGTLLSSGWVGSSAPYSQTISITGMLNTDNAIVDVVQTGTYATDQTLLDGFSNVYRMVSGTNQVTAYAKAKPTVDLPLQFKVVR